MAQITTYATKAVPEGADKAVITDSNDGSTKNALLSALPISAATQTALDLKAALAGTSGGKTIVGGTGVTDILKLKGTSGNGTATSPAIQALVGNDGATTAVTVLNNGNVGIGTASPTAVLHLKAGTATASTAPLKLTSGTDLTTAEAGAVEYDGTNLHFTPTGTLREDIFVGSKGSSTLTSGTTTTVTVGNAKTTSVILIQPTSAAITLLGVYVSAKNNGTFVLTHGIAAGTEAFDYAIIN